MLGQIRVARSGWQCFTRSVATSPSVHSLQLTSLPSPHLTPLGFVPEYIVSFSTDQSEPPHRTRHTTRQTQTDPGAWRAVPQVTSPVPRGAGHRRPITGQEAPARPGPDLAPGATRSRWPAGPPRGPAGDSASAAQQRSVATPSDPSNFRPISLVPVIMKIFERVIHQQLYHYLSHNHLLSSAQHGSGPDTPPRPRVINHELLITKLKMHGIETSWFADDLQGHTQSVSLYDGSRRKVLSRPLPNTMGVFQGSALGPLLFTLYSGDAVAFQYADDTQVLVSGPRNDIGGLIARMEASLASPNAWFCAHGLKVNAAKTQLMVFGSRQNLSTLPNFKISFRDAELQPCTQAKNLGVVFDGALTWDAHASELSRRCVGVLIGLTISHARHCLPDGVLKTIVTALVISRVQQ